jgi:hypothetical protein
LQLTDLISRLQRWHLTSFARGALPEPLETDWLVGAAGFEPLNFKIGIREDSQLGAREVEHAHLD